jgi:hypothetical protein
VDVEETPSDLAFGLKLLLGLLVVVAGVAQSRKRPKQGEEPKRRGWSQHLKE